MTEIGSFLPPLDSFLLLTIINEKDYFIIRGNLVLVISGCKITII